MTMPSDAGSFIKRDTSLTYLKYGQRHGRRSRPVRLLYAHSSNILYPSLIRNSENELYGSEWNVSIPTDSLEDHDQFKMLRSFKRTVESPYLRRAIDNEETKQPSIQCT